LLWKLLGWYKRNMVIILTICKRFLVPCFIILMTTLQIVMTICDFYIPLQPPVCFAVWYYLGYHFILLNINFRLFALWRISLHFLKLNLFAEIPLNFLGIIFSHFTWDNC
jgi:hypothetical protein